jgi:hypothetical protein
VKKIINAIGHFFERAFPATMIALPAFLVCAIAADILFSWTSSAGPDSAVRFGRGFGKAGFILTAAALSYYLLRSCAVFLSKHGIILPHIANDVLKSLVSFLRAVHPTLGETAIVLLAAHGYIMFFRTSGTEFNPYTASGISTYLVFAVVGTFGYLLYKNRTSKKIRTSHRIVALFAILAVCTHLIVVKFL